MLFQVCYLPIPSSAVHPPFVLACPIASVSSRFPSPVLRLDPLHSNAARPRRYRQSFSW
ncbi:hypothetical protein BT69DRAFT_1279667 [Atractiella rhizophila]|nr:hypothetical protein BT69DRAFT_1279667 [Atractiella rhizophila]